MAFGWHAARLLGVILIFSFSSSVLLFLSREKIPLKSLDSTNIDGSDVRPSWYYASLAHKNAYQLDPAPTDPPYGAVVAAAQDSTDLSWMINFEQK